MVIFHSYVSLPVGKRWLGNSSPVFGWQASGEILEWMESSGPELLCGQNMATANTDCSHCHYLVGGLEHFFFHILGIIIPTDFHIFQRGRRKTTNQLHSVWICCLWKAHLTANIPWDVRGWTYNSDKSRRSSIGFINFRCPFLGRTII